MTRRGVGDVIRTAGLGAAAAPVVVALVVRWSLGGAPPHAGATIALGAPLTESSPPLPRSDAATASVETFSRAALREPFAASPMHRVQEPAQEIAAPTPSVAEPRPEPTPVFHVTAVLVGKRATLVTINGRLRRVGDEVAPGWRLVSIDADAAELTIVAEDGRREVVSIASLLR